MTASTPPSPEKKTAVCHVHAIHAMSMPFPHTRPSAKPLAM
jgi:hypothetical protein